jgi:hypothetical protein
MAKALETIADPIWLRKALETAAEALGSVEFAKAQIRKWLAAGDLPWTCISWQALDAEGIASVRRKLDASDIVMLQPPSGPYCEGEPAFWRCTAVKIDWDNNSAREAGLADGGAKAEGIKVSLGRLRALLPEPEEAAPEPEDERAFKALYGNRTARTELPRVETMLSEISKRLEKPYSKRSLERLLERLRKAAANR